MFIKDPCGIVCIIVTYAAVFYADYVVIKWIILQSMHERYILVIYFLIVKIEMCV